MLFLGVQAMDFFLRQKAEIGDKDNPSMYSLKPQRAACQTVEHFAALFVLLFSVWCAGD